MIFMSSLVRLWASGYQGCQLRQAKRLTAYRTWAYGGWGARESSRSLQRISLGETVGNMTGRTQGGLAASKTTRKRGLRGAQRMANGLHEVGMRVEERQPFSSAVAE